MASLPSINTWKIEIESTGADSYTIKTDAASGSNTAQRLEFDTSFARNNTEYLALKEQMTRSDREAARQVGTKLFAFLFGGQIGTAFNERCDSLGPRGMSNSDTATDQRPPNVLRLVLEFTGPDRLLSDEPWEYLYSHEYAFLAQNEFFSIVRYVRPLRLNEERQPVSVADADVLVLVGNPPPGSTNERLKPESEIHAIKDALHKNEIKLLEGEECSLHGLEDHFRTEPTRYQILHFIGHSGDGHILLQNDNVEVPVSTVILAQVLQPYRSLRLLVFTSCATSSSIEPLIHLQGVPAVIAMQHDMWDEPAAVFTLVFYRKLREGLPLDVATNEARAALRNAYPSNNRYALLWGCPTISVSSLSALDCFVSSSEVESNSTVQSAPTGSHGPVTAPHEGLPIGEVSDLITEGLELGRAHTSSVTSLTFIKGTHVLISGSQDAVLRAWRCDPIAPSIGEPASPMNGHWTGHVDEIVALLAKPEVSGTYIVLSAGRDLQLRSWRWVDGTPLEWRRLPPSAIRQMALNPIYSTCVALVTEAGKVHYTNDIHAFLTYPSSSGGLDCGGEGKGVAFSCDGNWLAVAATRSVVRIWHCNPNDTLSEDYEELLHDQDELILSVVALSNNRLVTGAKSGKIFLWQQGVRQQPVQQIEGHGDGVALLSWIADHDLLLSASATSISLWKVTDKGTLRTPAVWSRNPIGGSVTSIAVYTEKESTIIAAGLSSGSIVLYYLRPQPGTTP